MNKPPRVLQILLLVLVLAGIGSWAWKSFGPKDGAVSGAGQSVVDAPDVVEPAHFVLVTYFTTDQRCPTCLKIEKLANETVTSGFAEELKRGELRFRAVNFDREENKHFIDDYDLVFKTVVVSDMRDHKEAEWAKFDEVWDLVGEPERFTEYLANGIRKYLNTGPDA